MTEPTVRATRLAREELRALPRNAFALGGAAAALALLAVAASSTGGPNALQQVLLFSWVLAPLLVAIVVAARVASVRRSRFAESLFTTPVTLRAWLAAEIMVGLALVAALLAASAPLVLVQTARIGFPAETWTLLAAGAALGVCCVALGLFCGVVVGEAGAGAAAGLAGGCVAVAFGGLVATTALASLPPDPLVTTTLALAHVSPLVLAVEASGTTLFGVLPATAWPAGVALVAMTLALFAAAWLAGTRAQSPLGWERRARGGGTVALVAALVVASLVLPVATASTSYHETERRNAAFFDPGETQDLALVPRGHAADDAVFTAYWYVRSDPLTFGADNALDLLVMTHAPANATVTGLRVTLDPSAAFVVALGEPTRDGTARPTRGFGFPGDPTGEAEPVFRIPLVLRPVVAASLHYDHELLRGNVSFAVDGKPSGSAFLVTAFASVPNSRAQMLAAGAPLPLACVGALATRARRTR